MWIGGFTPSSSIQISFKKIQCMIIYKKNSKTIENNENFI